MQKKWLKKCIFLLMPSIGYFLPTYFLPASNWHTTTLRAANWSTPYHVERELYI